MLQFLKYVFATIIGIFLFTILSFIVLIGIGSLMSSSDTKTQVESNSVLKLDLNKIIRENATENEPLTEILTGGNGSGQVSLPQIQEALANAKIDPNIKGYTWNKQKGKWWARIKVNGKQQHLGFYDREDEAHNAYLVAKRETLRALA
jgi:hypothetical protein